MKIRFWGTRGSIAKAGSTTIRYGGNTSCVEIRSAANDVVILDAGTGIHGLGHHILRESIVPRTASIFISHTHWDHIQGLPFFAPFFLPHHKWSVFGPAGVQENLADILRGQMSKAYFPISMRDFHADIQHNNLTEGRFQIGDISVTTQYLNHPGVTVGYRIEVDGVTVVYSTDHEPHARRLAQGGIPDKGSEDERHGQFLANADFVIHDAQYTAAEYDKRVGWGHSTMEYVVDLAARADVQHLVLFHHDPNRTDAEVDQIVEMARRRLGDRPGKTEITAAAEGNDLVKHRPKQLMVATAQADLGNSGAATESDGDPERTNGQEALQAGSALNDCKVRIPIIIFAPAFPIVEQAVREAGHTALVATTMAAAQDIFRKHAPAVVFIEAGDVAEFAERWKVISGQTSISSETTVAPMKILVSQREPPAGAIDHANIQRVLVAPFSLIYATSRVLIWTNQSSQIWHRAEFPNDDTIRLGVVQRVKRVLGDATVAQDLQQYVEIARSLLWNLNHDDVVIAFHLVGECDVESVVRSQMRRLNGKTESNVSQGLPRDLSFCAHVVVNRVPLDLEDVADSDFRWHPEVVGGARVRSYFGVNVDVLGQTVGSFCVFSSQRLQLNDDQRRGFRAIAAMIGRRVEQSISANA